MAMLSYLRSFKATYPNNNQLIQAIIEQEIGLGQLNKAQTALNELSRQKKTELSEPIQWLQYLIYRHKTHQAQLNTSQRITYLRDLQQRAATLANASLDSEQLQMLAQDNLALAQAPIALKIYNRLFDQHALKKTTELAEGGHIAMQNNAHSDSAKFYWAAYLQSSKRSDKRIYAQKSLQALWSGNLLPKALLMANKLPADITDDRDLLLYLSRLALAANRPAIAQQYALKALQTFDDAAYQLAYQTSLYNADIGTAYTLARIAVYHHPNNLAWHEKLAQTATWRGDYNKAMREWLWVAERTDNLSKINHAISVTKTLGYDHVLEKLLALYLSKKPTDTHALQLLAETENRLYQPEKAFEILQKISTIHPSRPIDTLSAQIYQQWGQWDKALNIWQKINTKYTPDSDSVMAEADIFYQRGQFKQALHSLKLGIPHAHPEDQAFWDTLGDLAWRLNNQPLAVLGYSHHLKDYSHLVSLIQLEIVPHPKQALTYSMKGWFYFHKLIFFLNALSLSQQLQQWPAIEHLLSHLSLKKLATIEKHPEFWQAQANFYAALGEKKSQRAVLMQSVISHPQTLALKSDFLWFLMTQGETQGVGLLLNNWEKDQHSPVLWHAYAEGLDVLNQFYAAIECYQMHLFADFNQDQILIDYAGVLKKARFYKQAYDVREFVWHRALNKRLNHQQTLASLSQLASFYVSGTAQLPFLATLLNDYLDDQSLNIALNWLIARNDIDLIGFFKAYYLHNGLPYKADIILALAKNDLNTLQKLMGRSEQPFLRSERINTAVRLENTPLAEQIAFDELTDRPWANDIYTEFTYYGINDAQYGQIGEEYEQFINLIGTKTVLESKVKLTQKWKVRPYIKRWIVSSNDNSILTNVPGQDLQAGVKFEEKIHRGAIVYALGYRDALNSFTPLNIELNYRLNARWSALLNMGYNQEVFQTAYLRIGGVQDQLYLKFFYNPAKYDFLQAGIDAIGYYSQDRHYLANGFNAHGLYEHKVWLSYPDYTLGVFADVYNFNRNGSYGGDVRTLFPAQLNSSTNYQQLIPDSYTQGGFIFSFGNAILNYSHAWRPYLWASLFYNTYVGLANDVKIGMNSSLSGQDSLLFYAERGTAQAVSNAVTYTMGARYRIYF